MKYDIKALTLEEKLHLLTGKDGWRLETANGKLPEVFLSDGPHGLRMHEIKDGVTGPVMPATAMPFPCWQTRGTRSLPILQALPLPTTALKRVLTCCLHPV